jgi:hypothetical protein
MSDCPIVRTEAHRSFFFAMLLQAIIGASLKALKYFCIGTLHLPITFWMSNRDVANLDAKIFVVPLKDTTCKLGPIIGDDLV